MALRLNKRFDQLRSLYRNIFSAAESGLFIAQRAEVSRLLAQDRYQSDGHLIRFGYRIYSQHCEDGMLAEIFRRIGYSSRYFIEFGVGDGLENNTLALLLQGWSGLWIEGNPAFFSGIIAGLPKAIGSGRLAVKHSFITKDNIDDLIAAANPPRSVDLLSIDIDGNDYHVWRAIRAVRPRVVVIEYNPKFPPPIRYCMQYDEQHVWDGTDHYGASLSFLEEQFTFNDYLLVACDLTGTNAFFVRKDCVHDSFAGPFTPEFHYESAKLGLVSMPAGHPPSLKTIETQLSLPSNIRESESTIADVGTSLGSIGED